MRDFNTTVNMLVKAYLNNTLQHDNCYACAVGNIVAGCNNIEFGAGMNEGYNTRWRSSTPTWQYVILNLLGKSDTEFRVKCMKEINSTGYSWQELARVEKAFESVPRNLSEDERMFQGLMAVVDVLADIHQVDLTTKEQSKLLFVK